MQMGEGQGRGMVLFCAAPHAVAVDVLFAACISVPPLRLSTRHMVTAPQHTARRPTTPTPAQAR